MLYGKDIIAQNNIKKISLTMAVKEGRITAFDPNTRTPIDWDRLKINFEEIQRLYEKPGIVNKEISENRKRYDARIQRSQTQYVTYRKDIERSRIDILPDKVTNQGAQHKTQRIPWKDLLSNLQNERVQTAIPQRQYNDIRTGWGIQVMTLYVKKALFEESEINSLIHKSRLSQNEEEGVSLATHMKGHIYEPPELVIGIEAWTELYSKGEPEGRKTRKAAIEKWIVNHYPKLKVETVKRIATVVNPFKAGGATPSDI